METEYYFSVKIKLKQDDKLTREEAKKYVKEAIQGYRGMFHPDSTEYKMDANQFIVNDMYPARDRDK